MSSQETSLTIHHPPPSKWRNPRGRRRKPNDLNDMDYDDGGVLSDSELGRRLSQESSPKYRSFADGYYSDGGLEDTLPSVRAFAASMQTSANGQRAQRETTPLLPSDGGGGGLDTKPTTSPSSGYESLPPPVTKRGKRIALLKLCYKHTKVAVLTTFVLLCAILFAINKEEEQDIVFLSIRDRMSESVRYIEEARQWSYVTLSITGPFDDMTYHMENNTENVTDSVSRIAAGTVCDGFIFICAPEGFNGSCPEPENMPEGMDCQSVKLNKDFDHSRPEIKTVVRALKTKRQENANYSINFATNNEHIVEFQVAIRGEIASETVQVIIAAIILVIVYVLIAFDVVHRTLAAMIGSTCVLGVLSMLDKRPTLDAVVEWIDLETICLLFGMMALVGIFSQTGFFDYSAVKAYKLARGKVWPLITILCIFSAVTSAFLDNVTTILLLTPVSIRLCQVLNLDPRPVLIAEVVFSNIGGTATAVGDPPNVIIISNELIKEAGILFPEFTLHLVLGIICCVVVAYALLSIINCFKYIRIKNKDPPQIAELKREVAIWERTARNLPIVSLEERAVRDALIAKANEVRNQLRQQLNVSVRSAQDLWQKNLSELESKYRITNKILLAKSSVVLLVVIILFFFSNTIPGIELELGWIAIFGAVVLIIMADIQELETILHKIEWSTLLFFAALFILMEGLQELGLIKFIGQIIVTIIKQVPQEHQMMVAIFLVVWVSALASSFIDNIPFTTATIPVIVDLADSPDICLSLKPLVWALAFGACLGGNGTLIGASANVVCAGIAEQNGYPISFKDFFKIGFPMMLVTTFTAWIYLMICHVAAGWNVGVEC